MSQLPQAARRRSSVSTPKAASTIRHLGTEDPFVAYPVRSELGASSRADLFSAQRSSVI
jgi:hypothetical protein